MIEIPFSLSWRMIVTSSAISSPVRLELGSSMMMSFELKESALTISTICFSDTESSDTSLVVGTLQPMLSRSSRALA